MSTTQWRKLVRDPEDVACAAEEGRIMCNELWEEIVTEVEDAKEGLRTAAV